MLGNEEYEWISVLFGNLAILCFILGSIYMPVKWMKHLITIKTTDMKRIIKNLLKFHIIFNAAAISCVLVHFLTAETYNATLIVALVILFWLPIEGLILKYKLGINKNVRKYVYVIHCQQFFSIAAIVLLIVGHILIDD